MFKIFKLIFCIEELCGSVKNKLYSAQILQIKQEGIVFCMSLRYINNSSKAISEPHEK